MILKKTIKIQELLIHIKQANREDKIIKYKKEYGNEAQIKDNCEIRINNELIPFSFFIILIKK